MPTQNLESINISDIQDLRLQMVRLEESLKTAIQTTSEQFKSHHEKLDTHTKCVNNLKKDISEIKIKFAERKNFDPQEEYANYRHVIEMRKTGTMIKSTLIKTVIPIVVSFILGILVTYGSFTDIKEKKVEDVVKEHIENKYDLSPGGSDEN